MDRYELDRVSDMVLAHLRDNHIGQASVWLTWALLGDQVDLDYLQARMVRVMPDLRRDYNHERGEVPYQWTPRDVLYDDPRPWIPTAQEFRARMGA